MGRLVAHVPIVSHLVVVENEYPSHHKISFEITFSIMFWSKVLVKCHFIASPVAVAWTSALRTVGDAKMIGLIDTEISRTAYENIIGSGWQPL